MEKTKKKQDMTGNGIGDEGVKALSEMLKVNTTLTSLNLRCENKENRKERPNQRADNRQWD